MNNLQLIEGLCNQIEIQNEIIKHLAMRLAEISALTEEEQREINVAHNAYKNLIGDTFI